MARALEIAGNVLLGLGLATVLIGHLGVWYFQGFWAMTALLSPWNVLNFLAIMLVLAPGLICKMIAERLRARPHRPPQVPPVDAA